MTLFILRNRTTLWLRSTSYSSVLLICPKPFPVDVGLRWVYQECIISQCSVSGCCLSLYDTFARKRYGSVFWDKTLYVPSTLQLSAYSGLIGYLTILNCINIINVLNSAVIFRWLLWKVPPWPKLDVTPSWRQWSSAVDLLCAGQSVRSPTFYALLATRSIPTPGSTTSPMLSRH